MTDLFAEVTKGDPFYYEIGFTDIYGSPQNMTGWSVSAAFKTSFAGTVLASLTLDNDGIGFLNDDTSGGVIYLNLDADSLATIDLPEYPRNGDLVPSRTVVGEIKLVPPDGIELVQGAGSRTVLFLKVKAGLA